MKLMGRVKNVDGVDEGGGVSTVGGAGQSYL